jgi:hypothetical protein
MTSRSEAAALSSRGAGGVGSDRRVPVVIGCTDRDHVADEQSLAANGGNPDLRCPSAGLTSRFRLAKELIRWYTSPATVRGTDAQVMATVRDLE